jgi:hypothetical protein
MLENQNPYAVIVMFVTEWINVNLYQYSYYLLKMIQMAAKQIQTLFMLL